MDGTIMVKRRRAGRNGRDAKAGLTIIELVITTGVVAICIAGLVHLFVYCMWETETAGGQTEAASEAFGKIEEIRTCPFDDIAPTYGPGGNPGDTFLLVRQEGKGVITLTKPDPDLVEVEVVVCWRRGNMIIGEDQNLNGVLEKNEDLNGNGVIDSPVAMTTLIARR